ncbi:MAG: CBS domain-containing protein [Halobacteriaceae archaeon]
MRKFTIGRVFGIPIRLDLTFLLILPILAWVISTQVTVWVDQLNLLWGVGIESGPLTEGNTALLLGVVAAVGLFAGVLLHELGHSVVSMHYGYPIDSITLWILGGIAQLGDQPEDWKQEFFIAVAGPVVSIALGVGSYAVLVSLPASLDMLRFVFGYLALMNLVLAAFNLLPGFPMDGGRVLRALLARNRPFAQATQIAAEVGKLFAIVLGIVGVFANLFLVLIAFFIYIGASGEAQRTVMNAAFQGVSVRDIMTPASEVETVAADATVADLVDRMFRERHTGYPVMENGRLAGLVTLEDARRVDPVERDAYRVEDVMTPASELLTVGADTNAMDAFDTMQSNGVGRLLVTDGGELVGIISRTDIMTALDIIRNAGTSSSVPTTRQGTGAEGDSTRPA